MGGCAVPAGVLQAAWIGPLQCCAGGGAWWLWGSGRTCAHNASVLPPALPGHVGHASLSLLLTVSPVQGAWNAKGAVLVVLSHHPDDASSLTVALLMPHLASAVCSAA